MKQEEKELLIKDLCARLLYGLKCRCDIWPDRVKTIATVYPNENVLIGVVEVDLDKVKPYLRPMSSMSEEELKEFRACHCLYELHPDFQPMMCNLANELNMFDWLNAHHFDYRGLIKKGLALEAHKDMYNIK